MTMMMTRMTSAAATAMAKSAAKVTNFLTTPSQVAHALDWKKVNGSIVCLDISRDKLQVAVATHPALGEPTQLLDPIPLRLECRGRTKVLTKDVIEELNHIVQSHKVCGFVVSWPIQSDTGRVGASCGRVLHTLDSLVQASSSLVTPSRPICLWDGERHVIMPCEDEWGRCSSYAEPAPHASEEEKPYRASCEQYDKSKCHNSAAMDVWNDFCQAHWPQLYTAKIRSSKQTTKTTTTTSAAAAAAAPSSTWNQGNNYWLDDSDDFGYYQSATSVL